MVIFPPFLIQLLDKFFLAFLIKKEKDLNKGSSKLQKIYKVFLYFIFPDFLFAYFV